MKLSLGMPKGSLQEPTRELFGKAGIHLRFDGRSYFPGSDDDDLDLVLMRPQEMPRYVEEGVLDAAITGHDWVVENNAKVHTVCEMEYSRASRQKARWVLAVPESSTFRKPRDLQGRRVATELVNSTKRYFKKLGVTVDVEFSWGATEVKPPRLVDAIVELTETGGSLRENRLRIIDTLMESGTVLIANRRAWNNKVKRRKLENLRLLLQAALDAENYVGLKCNVEKKNLDRIIKGLPAMHNPTISHLSDQEWLAVETIIPVSEAKNIIPALKRAGASGIIEYPVSKVVA